MQSNGPTEAWRAGARFPGIMSARCAACGSRLGADAWSSSVCTEDCLDDFVACHVPPAMAGAAVAARPIAAAA